MVLSSSQDCQVGVKGAGKGGMAATPTVENATLDALATLGVTDVPIPAIPERKWWAVRQG